MRHPMARALLLCALTGSSGLSAERAFAQGCAQPPDPAAPHVRTFAGTCGTAVFPITPRDRQGGQLSLQVARGQLYVRVLRLTYANGGASVQSDMRLHRLFTDGEATPVFATSRDGLPLISVTADVAPPGAGADPVYLALGTSAANGIATGSVVAAPATIGALAGHGWVMAASANANLASRRDTLEIGRQKGRFEALVLSGRGQDLPVQSVQIVPFSGLAFTVDLSATLAAGTLSVPIAINPPDFLRSVTITYGTPSPQALQRLAVVEVRGRHAETWAGAVGENRQHAGGWLLLGTVDVVIVPHRPRPSLRLSGAEGSFKKLRFISRRGSIDLVGATVEAGDGRSETIAINALLAPDQPSPPQGFTNGAALPIATISLMPRLRAQSRIDATVEVWAQY